MRTKANELIELRQERKALLDEAGVIIGAASKERRDFTRKENERFEKLHAKAETLRGIIERQERQESGSSDLDLPLKLGIRDGLHGSSDLSGLDGNDKPLSAGAQRQLEEAMGLWFRGVVTKSKDLVARSMEVARASQSETRAAMQEDTAAEGGYLVPTPLKGEVLRLMKDYGIIRKLARIIPMDSKTLQVPDVASKPSVSIIAEEGAISQSDTTIGSNTITAKKLIAYGLFSNELKDDSIIPLGRLLMDLFVESMTSTEDAQALEGDGTGDNFTGILTAATANTTPAASATDLDPFITAMSALGARSARAMRNAVWVFHPLAWMTIQQLKTATEGIYYLNSQPTEGTPLSLLGRPVYLSDQIVVTAATPDTTNGYFGDFSGLLFGERLAPFVFSDPYTAAGNWQTKLYVGERVGINVALPDAFQIISGIDSE